MFDFFQQPTAPSPGAFAWPDAMGASAAQLESPLTLAAQGKGMTQQLPPLAEVFLALLTRGGVMPYQSVGGNPMMQMLGQLGQAPMGGQLPQGPAMGAQPPGASMMGAMPGQFPGNY